MPLSFARWLYSEPTMGMRVVITDQRPAQSTVAVSRTEDVPAVAVSAPPPEADTASDTDDAYDESDTPQ